MSATPVVDLVLIFSVNDNERQAERAYESLLSALRGAGLLATGRKGGSKGEILILIHCPQKKLEELVSRERQLDFLRGLPVPLPLSPSTTSSADKLRVVYEYVTSSALDGGLAIVSSSKSHVRSIMVLHDDEFNSKWIKSWVSARQSPRRSRWKRLAFGFSQKELDIIKNHFGHDVALYFAFLTYYTYSLIPLSAIALVYSPIGLNKPYAGPYSFMLVLWSLIFVEAWRVRERILAVHWRTRGAFRVERRRVVPGDRNAQENAEIGERETKIAWWNRDLRILASLPVVLFFASILAALLTAIFILEAFVTQLYTGPGNQFVSFTPTILFVLLVPRLMAVYTATASSLTSFEHHTHQSTHDKSYALKTFALNAIVAYLGLGLSAFVYIPYGGDILNLVRAFVGETAAAIAAGAMQNTGNVKVTSGNSNGTRAFFDSSASVKLNPGRLQSQMYAYTVTNQVINTFVEVGLPFITRWIAERRNGDSKNSDATSIKIKSDRKPESGWSKKRVEFEDDTAKKEKEFDGDISMDDHDTSTVISSPSLPGSDLSGTSPSSNSSSSRDAKHERAFLARVRGEAALPEYTTFGDYAEMVTQFGYVVIWSTIWPLAAVTSVLNNWLEVRSDAFKIAHHARRAVPTPRYETIGPWIDALSALSWVGAVINAALWALFGGGGPGVKGVVGSGMTSSKFNSTAEGVKIKLTDFSTISTSPYATSLIPHAMLVALCASHLYVLTRIVVRHVVKRIMWEGSGEAAREESESRIVRAGYLGFIGGVGAGGDNSLLDAAGGAGALQARIGREPTEVVAKTLTPEKTQVDSSAPQESNAFWQRDEGLDEIRRDLKED